MEVANSLVAALAALGALAAALATFMTVQEMKRQRETSYLPDLVFANVLLSGRRNADCGIGDFVWEVEPVGSRVGRQDVDPRARDIPNEWPGPTLVNLGMGAAKDVTVRWAVDLAALARMLNDVSNRCEAPVRVNYDENRDRLRIEGDGFVEAWCLGIHEPDQWPFLPSIATHNSGLVTEFPAVLLKLYSLTHCLVAMSRVDTDQLPDPDLVFPAMAVEIRYSDLGGTRHSKSLSLCLRCIDVLRTSVEDPQIDELFVDFTLVEGKPPGPSRLGHASPRN